MTVYVEQILIANFLTGGALLWFTGRLWGRRMIRWRWACASLLAALWAVAATVPGLPALGAPWMWGVGLAGITALCFRPSGYRDFARLWVTVCGATLVAGGAATAAWARLRAPYAAACTPLGLAALAVTARFVLPGWRSGLRRFEAVIGCPGGAQLPALVDSGNRLREPLSGLPVIVAGRDAAAALSGGPVGEETEGVRWIPCHTAAGGRTLPAVLVRSVRIRLGGPWTECGPVYVAVTDCELPGGMAALVPPLPRLVNGRKTWRHCA